MVYTRYDKVFTSDEVVQELENFIFEEKIQKGNTVKLIVGTDSQRRGSNKHLFVVGIAILSVGHGATFFIRREWVNKKMYLSDKLFKEVEMSLEVAKKLKGNSFIDILDEKDIEVHADVGFKGKSSKYANAIKAMIESQGFIGKIKPLAPIATHLADHFCR